MSLHILHGSKTWYDASRFWLSWQDRQQHTSKISIKEWNNDFYQKETILKIDQSAAEPNEAEDDYNDTFKRLKSK